MKMIEENQECRRYLEDYTMCSSEFEAETNLCGGWQKGEGCGHVGEGLQKEPKKRLAGLIDPGATGYFVNN